MKDPNEFHYQPILSKEKIIGLQKNQKKFILQEQIRILQDELGDSAELHPDLAKLKKAIDNADMPENVNAKANEEFEKLKNTPQMSPDFSFEKLS